MLISFFLISYHFKYENNLSIINTKSIFVRDTVAEYLVTQANDIHDTNEAVASGVKSYNVFDEFHYSFELHASEYLDHYSHMLSITS